MIIITFSNRTIIYTATTICLCALIIFATIKAEEEYKRQDLVQQEQIQVKGN